MNTKRLLLPLLTTALTVAVAASAVAASDQPLRRSFPATTRPTLDSKPRRVNPVVVRRLRRTVLHWRAVMGVGRGGFLAVPLHTPRALRYWRSQLRRTTRLAANPPHKGGWLCIHRFEASWQDGGDPYWGGLQMDRSFMRSYAPRVLLLRGWADRWSPLEQMWVAERAHRSGRGYWPWPNTARSCGLL